MYPNNMFRYCGTEIYCIVPNVTAEAAYMYAYMNEKSKCNILLNALRNNCINGNWEYIDTKNNKSFRVEDS